MKCPACGAVNIDGADLCDSCHGPLTESGAAPRAGMERRILTGTVAALKPRPAESLPAAASVAQAVELMRGKKMGCVLVVEAGRLRGIFSERELLFGAGDVDLGWLRVADLMRPGETPLAEDLPVADAFHQMAVSGHRHLPVALKDGRLGVVSARDLLGYLCQ